MSVIRPRADSTSADDGVPGVTEALAAFSVAGLHIGVLIFRFDPEVDAPSILQRAAHVASLETRAGRDLVEVIGRDLVVFAQAEPDASLALLAVRLRDRLSAAGLNTGPVISGRFRTGFGWVQELSSEAGDLLFPAGTEYRVRLAG